MNVSFKEIFTWVRYLQSSKRNFIRSQAMFEKIEIEAEGNTYLFSLHVCLALCITLGET